MSDPLDIGPVNVSGSHQARRVRVVWTAGRLHVFRTRTNVTSFDTPEPTETSPGTWEADGITFSRKGCSACGWQHGLGKHSTADLLASVE